MVRMFGFAVLVTTSSACVKTHECTAIGCMDQASVSIQTPSHRWPDGRYDFEFRIDGTVHTCSLTLPDDLPVTGAVHALDCGREIMVNFSQDATCTEHRDGGTASHVCTPIPGQWTLQGSMYGTPREVGVKVSRDGAVLVDVTKTPAYREERPNGPDCDPVCRQANVDVEVPDPS